MSPSFALLERFTFTGLAKLPPVWAIGAAGAFVLLLYILRLRRRQRIRICRRYVSAADTSIERIRICADTYLLTGIFLEILPSEILLSNSAPKREHVTQKRQEGFGVTRVSGISRLLKIQDPRINEHATRAVSPQS